MDEQGELWDDCTVYLMYKDGVGEDDIIDTFAVPSLSSQYSRARFRDSNDNPLDTIYTDSTPTKGTKNDLIPEFKDIVYPLMGTLVVYAVVRRRSHPKVAQQAAVAAATQASRKPFNA